MARKPTNTKLKKLCELCGISARMVQYHEEHGIFPKREPGQDYNIEKCVKAYIELIKKEKAAAPKSKAEDEYRKMKAMREKLKFDHERGALVAKTDVVAACKFALTVVKTSLMNLVKSLPPLLEGKSQEEIEITLDSEIVNILSSLSEGFKDIESQKTTK